MEFLILFYAQCQLLSRRKNQNEYLYDKKQISPPDVHMFKARGDDGRYDYKDSEQSVSSMDAKENRETSIMYDYKEVPWPTITIRFPGERPSPMTSQTRRTFTWRDLFPPLRTTKKYEVTDTTSIPSQTMRDLDQNTFKFVDWSAVTAVSNEPTFSTSKIGVVLPSSRYKSVEQSTVANTAVVKDYSPMSSLKQTYRTTMKGKSKITHVPEKTSPVLLPLKSRRMFQPYITDLTYSEHSSIGISNSSSDSVYRVITSTEKTSSRKKDIPTRTSKSAKSIFNSSNLTSTYHNVNAHVTSNDFNFFNFGKSTKTILEIPTLIPEHYVPRRDHHVSDDSLKFSSTVKGLKPFASRRVSSDIYPDTSFVFSIPSQSSRGLSSLSYLGNISELLLSTSSGPEVSDDTLYLPTTSSYALAKKQPGDSNKVSLIQPMRDDSDDVRFEIYYYTDDYSLNKTTVVTNIDEVAKIEAWDTSTVSVHPISILKRNTPYIINGIFFDEPTSRVPSSYMYGDYVVFPFTRVVISSRALNEYFNSENTTPTPVLLKWPPMDQKDEKIRSVDVNYLLPTTPRSKTPSTSVPVFYVIKNNKTALGLGRRPVSPDQEMFLQGAGYPRGLTTRRPFFSRTFSTRRPLDDFFKFSRDPDNRFHPKFKVGRKKKRPLSARPKQATPPAPKSFLCYECGLTEKNFSTPRCNNIFEPPNMQGAYLKRKSRKTCPNQTIVGCFKRYLDVGSCYEERGCRSWPPARGKSYMSSKFMRLEYLLRRTSDGCVTSPHAILVPFSRTIQLYARVHVCVCSKRLCNRATRNNPGFYLPLSLSIFVLLTND